MKKLFLTSGIIACMACPAFADITLNNVAYTATPAEGASNNSYPAGSGDDNPTLAQFTGTVDDACVEPALGTYSGTTNFIAQWQKNWWEIDIDSNVGTTTATGGVNNATPDPLYAIVGTGVYQTKDANDNFSSPVATDGNVFTNSPYTQVTQGLLVNYDLKYNLPGHRAEGDVTAWATSTGGNRPLIGYYIWDASLNNNAGGFSTTNTYKMIDEYGQLTSYGTSAASGASADQIWKAQWGSVTPTITGTPDIYGYSFVRWDLNTDSTVDTPGAITEDSVDVYAIWSADKYSITYTCGSGADIVGQPHTGYNTSTYNSAEFDQPYTWLANNDATDCGKLGYHFTGWTCTTSNLVANAPEGSGTLISNAGVTAHMNNNEAVPHQWDGVALTGNGWVFPGLTNGAAITCTAQYEPNTVTITWNGDHADATWTAPTNSAANSCIYDGAVTLPTTPTRSGYVFTGWAVGTGTGTGQNGAAAPTPDTSVRNSLVSSGTQEPAETPAP